MKKIINTFLIFVGLLSVYSCGGSDGGEDISSGTAKHNGQNYSLAQSIVYHYTDTNTDFPSYDNNDVYLTDGSGKQIAYFELFSTGNFVGTYTVGATSGNTYMVNAIQLLYAQGTIVYKENIKSGTVTVSKFDTSSKKITIVYDLTSKDGKKYLGSFDGSYALTEKSTK